MSCCTARTFLLTVLALQMLATVQREVFDFLGYMWAPIIGNFFQIICVIFGIFGIYHFRPKYLAVYCVWSFIWIGWNVFIICLYLEIGILRIKSDILDLGTGSHSWWAENGIGCRLISNYSVSEVERNQFSTPPSAYEGCLVEFYYIECIQAGVQCFFALLGFIASAYVIYVYTEEDDSFDFIGGFDSFSSYHSPSKTSHIHLQPIYEEKHQRSTV